MEDAEIVGEMESIREAGREKHALTFAATPMPTANTILIKSRIAHVARVLPAMAIVVEKSVPSRLEVVTQSDAG